MKDEHKVLLKLIELALKHKKTIGVFVEDSEINIENGQIVIRRVISEYKIQLSDPKCFDKFIEMISSPEPEFEQFEIDDHFYAIENKKVNEILNKYTKYDDTINKLMKIAVPSETSNRDSIDWQIFSDDDDSIKEFVDSWKETYPEKFIKKPKKKGRKS